VSAARLEVQSDGNPRAAKISVDGEPVTRASHLKIEMGVDGTAYFQLTYPIPIVTLSARDLSAVRVYRAQLVSTLDIDPALDGLTAEAHSVEDALQALLDKVRTVRGNRD
jgi:hypothetical protein